MSTVHVHFNHHTKECIIASALFSVINKTSFLTLEWEPEVGLIDELNRHFENRHGQMCMV